MWLLESETRSRIESARLSGYVPSASENDKYEASAGSVLSVKGQTAIINVKGVLTKNPDIMAMIFGGGNTTYAQIISSVEQANADHRIKDIVMNVDSGGGQVDGLFDAVATLQSSKKPIKAIVGGMAASAAYALVASADTIVASSKASIVGSIGIVASFRTDDDIVSVTSTNAPKKRPDVKTEEGVAIVREELDALHELFVGAIADGRGISAKKINADFGQGGVLLAEEALKRGMIDSIHSGTTTPATSGIKHKATIMDLTELKATHPATYAAAVDAGINQERDRVSAHLMLGEASGDTKTASEAIKNGSEMTATLQATYMAANMRNRDINASVQDDAQANAGDTTPDDEVKPKADSVMDLIEASMGIEAGV